MGGRREADLDRDQLPSVLVHPLIHLGGLRGGIRGRKPMHQRHDGGWASGSFAQHGHRPSEASLARVSAPEEEHDVTLMNCMIMAHDASPALNSKSIWDLFHREVSIAVAACRNTRHSKAGCSQRDIDRPRAYTGIFWHDMHSASPNVPLFPHPLFASHKQEAGLKKTQGQSHWWAMLRHALFRNSQVTIGSLQSPRSVGTGAAMTSLLSYAPHFGRR